MSAMIITAIMTIQFVSISVLISPSFRSNACAFLEVNAVIIDPTNATIPIADTGINIFSKYADDMDKLIDKTVAIGSENSIRYLTTLCVIVYFIASMICLNELTTENFRCGLYSQLFNHPLTSPTKQTKHCP